MPRQADGRVFRSKAQMRQAFAADPARAQRWLEEEREAGITEHRSLPERITTTKEPSMATRATGRSTGRGRQRDSLGRPNEGSRDRGIGPNSRTRGGARGRSGSARPAANRQQSTRPAQVSGRATGRTGRSREELREMARGSGIPYWYRMNSGELEDALNL